MQASGSINDQDVAAGIHRLFTRLFGQTLDRRRVRLLNFAFVKVRLDGLRHNFELLAGRGAIDVHRDQHGAVPAFLQPCGQFACGGGFARSLKSGHQDNRRRRAEPQLGGIAAQDLDQFIVNDLDYLLRRRERRHYFLANRFCLDLVNELLDHFEVDVRLQQRHADFLKRLLDVFLAQLALAAQVLECSL